jgi:hypothetical protein
MAVAEIEGLLSGSFPEALEVVEPPGPLAPRWGFGQEGAFSHVSAALASCPDRPAPNGPGSWFPMRSPAKTVPRRTDIGRESIGRQERAEHGPQASIEAKGMFTSRKWDFLWSQAEGVEPSWPLRYTIAVIGRVARDGCHMTASAYPRPSEGTEHMSSLRKRVEARLQERISQIRQESDQALPDDMFDPVFDHLDELIEIVSSIQNFSTEPYLDKVREVVCTVCIVSPDGICVKRDERTCGLDVYFPTIVASIEEVLRTDTGLEE